MDLINKSETGDIDLGFPNTYDIFDENSIKVNQHDNTYIQLSLKTIRESIEQPIGSPKLRYKNEPIIDRIENIDKFDKVFAFKDGDREVIIIPDLTDDKLLESYIDNLKIYFQDNWRRDRNYVGNGKLITNVIYFKENEKIDQFKNWLIYQQDHDDNPIELPCLLKKLDIKNFNQFQIHNSQRIADFINSICQIGIIGKGSGELSFIDDEETIEIRRNEKWQFGRNDCFGLRGLCIK